MATTRRTAFPRSLCLPALAAMSALSGCGARPEAAAVAGPAPERSRTVRIALDVDATDLPRGLLHARETIPVTPGLVWLWFPKWMPGTHAPCGPVENLGGLRFSLPTGERLSWRRDEVELHRFGVTVPPGADSLVVRIDYICNQPTENSKGIDSAADATLGVISWNTCLLYPEGPDEDAVRILPTVDLPENWKQACAVPFTQKPVAPTAGAAPEHAFTGVEVSLRELIDSPLIGGEHLARYDVSSVPDQGPPLRLELDALAADAAGVTLDAEAQAAFVRLADEVHEQFPGRTPFGTYHLLAVASDVVEPTGLEHQSCSLNAFPAGSLTVPAAIAEQMAHEFCHAWCGKYRRPAGMYTRDFHTPERTRLLWVYEGLDMYLGEIMASRAQLGTTSSFVDRLRGEAQQLALNTGREWRSVDDTAIANWQLRGQSAHWGQMRRDQDYYLEGMLMWLEIDGIIRGESRGAKSLDDFCRSFFHVDDVASGAGIIPRPYGIDDVVAALQATLPHDWRALIDERMMGTASQLSFAGFERCGWRMRLADRRIEPWATYATAYQYLDESWSLGLVIQKGVIRQVIPGSPADLARLSPGMRVIRIGGKPLDISSLDQSLADSLKTGSVALRCQAGARTREATLAYAGGPRYFTLDRIDGTPDLMAAIGAPRSARGKAFLQRPVATPPAAEEETAEVPMEAADEAPGEPAAQEPERAEPVVEPAVPPPSDAAEPEPEEGGAAAAAAGGAVAPPRSTEPEPEAGVVP